MKAPLIHGDRRGTERRPPETGTALARSSVIQISEGLAAPLAPEVAPPLVHDVLSSPGRPLESATRSQFESQFRHGPETLPVRAVPIAPAGGLPINRPGDAYEMEADRFAERVVGRSGAGSADRTATDVGGFGGVRLHTDARAAESARAVGARAYTVGEHIVFGGGQFAPGTSAGDRLIAHELAHVLQQGAGDFPAPVLHRQEEPRADEPSPEGVAFYYRVRIDAALDDDALLIAFVKQYHGVETEEEARALVEQYDWHWTSTAPTITREDVVRGYKDISVRDLSRSPASPEERQARQREFAELPRAERRALEAEADRLFRERTGMARGESLGTGERGRVQAEFRRQLRDELVRQRGAIAALPERIRSVIFSRTGTRRVQPSDYAAVLRIAEKLNQLSDAELAGYSERTTARTEDLATFEASIDRYIAEMLERREAALARERARTRLFGLDDIYRRYRLYSGMQSQSAFLAGSQTAMGVGASLGTQPTLNRMREELTNDLREHGFSSIDEFKQTIDDFVRAFRDEATLLGLEMLDRTEHVLAEGQRQYSSRGETNRLYNRLQPARREFEEASRIRRESAMTMRGQADRLQAAEARWRSEITALGPTDPVLASSDPDLPYQEIATAGRRELPGVLGQYMRERREDVQETRQNLRDHPDLVFELDVLMQAARAQQDIQPGSLYDEILADHVHDAGIGQAIINLAIAVFAIAVGLLSGGTGTVAVLAGLASFGISAYQALEEYRLYEQRSAAAGAGLLSDDPSIAWLVVAVVGAGIDLGALTVTARNTLRGAAIAFNESGGDLAILADRLQGIDARLRANVLQAAELEARSRAAWRSILRPTPVLRAVVVPLGEEFARFVYAVYLSARRGLLSFERFVLTREAVDLIGDVSRLSPAELNLVKQGYTRTLAEVQRVAAHGQSLGMSQETIDYFFRLTARSRPASPADEIIRNMDQWAASAGGRTRPYVEAPDLVLDPQSRALLPDFDRRIAGTGRIESIRVSRPPGEGGGLSVTIEGEVLPGTLPRDARRAQPGQRLAPNFNTSDQLPRNVLGPDWERLHLWGPGFGDEAAAGMMRGPRAVNQIWQNQGVEAYGRALAEQARRQGGRLRLEATAVSWPNPTPSGWSAPAGEQFLKRAQYRFTLELPNRPPQGVTVTIDVAEPPAARLAGVSFDPPTAVDPSTLLSTP